MSIADFPEWAGIDEIDAELLAAIDAAGELALVVRTRLELVTAAAFAAHRKRMIEIDPNVVHRYKVIEQQRRDARKADTSRKMSALVETFLDGSRLRGELWYVDQQWALWDGRQYVRCLDNGRPNEVMKRARTWLSKNGKDEWGVRKITEFLRLVALEVTLPDNFVGWRDGRDGEWLACSNGVVNVLTGECVPLSSEFISFNNTGYPYDPKAQCPIFLKFLNDVLNQDPESITLAQRWFGYCLTLWTHLQVILLLIGPPRSGKGTLCRALQSVLGSGAAKDDSGNSGGMSLRTLARPHGLMGVLDKRVCVLGDLRGDGASSGAALDRLISISGEDVVDVDVKFGPILSRRLPLKLVMAANSAPFSTQTDGALQSRLRALWFETGHVGSEDVKLGERIATERSGILNWAMRGLTEIAAGEPLKMPARSRKPMERFADAMNPVLSFMREMCRRRSDENYAIKHDFRSTFVAWKSVYAPYTMTPHEARFTEIVREAAAQLGWQCSVGRTRVNKRQVPVYWGFEIGPPDDEEDGA